MYVKCRSGINRQVEILSWPATLYAPLTDSTSSSLSTFSPFECLFCEPACSQGSCRLCFPHLQSPVSVEVTLTGKIGVEISF